MKIIEYCVSVEPYIQPHPNKNPTGDCFACTLTAILHHLFPENKRDFNTIWNYFMTTYKDSNKECLSNTWAGMIRAIVEASRDGHKIEYTKDIVKPDYNLDYFSHSWWRFVPTEEYTRKLESWLKAGWLAISEISFNEVEKIEGGYRTDHFVFIDGVNSVWEPLKHCDGSSLVSYVHVVCSVKGAYWISTRDFLVKHGSAAWILIRKSLR